MLKDLGAKRVHVETVDVANEAEVAGAMASTLAAMGRIDCVFANAGYQDKAPSFPDMTSEMYHNLLNVNLHGAFYTLRAATAHMRDRALAGDPGGSVVVCGSLTIFQGRQGLEHYAAAKGALAAMINSIAVEMGQYQVRANMIAPGFILTGMTDDNPQTAGMIKHFSAITPLKRPGYLTDIEGPAAYLASDASSFHTGDVLVIDGGRRINSQ